MTLYQLPSSDRPYPPGVTVLARGRDWWGRGVTEVDPDDGRFVVRFDGGMIWRAPAAPRRAAQDLAELDLVAIQPP